MLNLEKDEEGVLLRGSENEALTVIVKILYKILTITSLMMH
jgi:hypothetical protein